MRVTRRLITRTSFAVMPQKIPYCLRWEICLGLQCCTQTAAKHNPKVFISPTAHILHITQPVLKGTSTNITHQSVFTGLAEYYSASETSTIWIRFIPPFQQMMPTLPTMQQSYFISFLWSHKRMFSHMQQFPSRPVDTLLYENVVELPFKSTL